MFSRHSGFVLAFSILSCTAEKTDTQSEPTEVVTSADSSGASSASSNAPVSPAAQTSSSNAASSSSTSGPIPQVPQEGAGGTSDNPATGGAGGASSGSSDPFGVGSADGTESGLAGNGGDDGLAGNPTSGDPSSNTTSNGGAPGVAGANSSGTDSGGANSSGGTPGTAGNGGSTAGNARAGNSDSTGVAVFDGESGYVEIPDADVFSAPTSGELSVEAWMRPDSLAMPNTESSGYVHWMGKGNSGQHEWVSRMYQQGNSEDRENRISFYSFNLSGGLGAGSYFQDTVTPGNWIHYVGTFDDTSTYLYKDGELRDSDLLSGYDITPENGTEPVRIGTRDNNSYFQGGIARVAFYSTRLSDEQVAAHFAARAVGSYDQTVLAEPSLVAFYKLDETTGSVAVDSKGDRDGTYLGGVALADAAWPLP